jgi:beta-phosphoglucomutase family hydrolase
MIQIIVGGYVMFRAVLFDMDGVIIDSEPLHTKAFQVSMKDYGLDLSDEYCYQFIGRTDRYMVEVLVDQFNLTDSVDTVLQHKKDTLIKLEQGEGYPPVPYVKELIQNLYQNKIKLAIASSSPMPAIRETAITQGLTEYFNEYVSGTELKNSKPAPDIFLKAAQMLGVDPSECVVIEDSEHGVAAAKAANMTCIGFYNPNSGNQNLSKADIIVEGFEEIDYNFLQTIYQRSHQLPVTIGTTTHCILRELSVENMVDLYRILSTPDVTQFMTEELASLEEEQDKLRAYIQNVYQFFGYGYWGIFEKDTEKLIGRCGIQTNEVDHVMEIELGYLLDPAYQGKGYALECAQFVLNYAFEHWNFSRIVAVIDVNNSRSIDLAKKLNMEKEKEIVHQGRNCGLYVIEHK